MGGGGAGGSGRRCGDGRRARRGRAAAAGGGSAHGRAPILGRPCPPGSLAAAVTGSAAALSVRARRSLGLVPSRAGLRRGVRTASVEGTAVNSRLRGQRGSEAASAGMMVFSLPVFITGRVSRFLSRAEKP